MKNLIKLTKKFILPGVFLVGLLFIASFAQAKLLKVLPGGEGGGLPITHYRASTFKVNGTHGTISPFYRDVLPGGTASFSVVPNGGYMAEYTGAATQATCIGHYSGTTYTTAPINADCTLTVTFVLKPPVVISFYPTDVKVDMNTHPKLNWDVTGANHCWVTGPNGYQSKNFTSNHPFVNLLVPPISVPATYYLQCTTDAIGTSSSPTTIKACRGTVVGSIDPKTGYQGKYEGYDCLVFKTQSTCLQGWVTHGCSWTSY